VRTSDQLAYPDIAQQLRDSLRFRIESLIESTVTSGSSDAVRRELQGQLRYDQHQLDEARARYNAFAATLSAYEQKANPSAELVPKTPAGDNREVMGTPVLSDVFIDRLVSLANRSVDLSYRQKLADDLRLAALQIVPLEAAVSYDTQLLAEIGKGDGPSAADAERDWQAAVTAVVKAVANLNALHQVISGQMYADALYATNGPTTVRLERSVSLKQLALVGFIVVVFAIAAAVFGAIIHSRLRQDQETDPQMLRELERESIRV
jgi:hypothetical protein